MAGGDAGIRLFDAWRGAADSAFDLAASGFEFSVVSTRAAMSVWQGSLGAKAEEPGDTESGEQKVVAERRVMAASEDVSQPAARSWYRAPYRSPFDPMFWLDPRSLSDTPMMLPGLWSTPSALASPSGALEMWSMSVRMWPMMEMGMRTMTASDGLMRNMDAMVQAGSALQASLLAPTPPVTSYRSAGGHAVAQIVAPGDGRQDLTGPRSGMVEADRQRDGAAAIAWPGDVAFELLKLWMPKNRLPA